MRIVPIDLLQSDSVYNDKRFKKDIDNLVSGEPKDFPVTHVVILDNNVITSIVPFMYNKLGDYNAVVNTFQVWCSNVAAHYSARLPDINRNVDADIMLAKKVYEDSITFAERNYKRASPPQLEIFKLISVDDIKNEDIYNDPLFQSNIDEVLAGEFMHREATLDGFTHAIIASTKLLNVVMFLKFTDGTASLRLEFFQTKNGEEVNKYDKETVYNYINYIVKNLTPKDLI